MNKNTIIATTIALLIGGTIGYLVAPKEQEIGSKQTTNEYTMQNSMEGMTTNLKGKKGEELDIAFLEGMIAHHQGAIAMANTLLKETKRPELQKMAQDIISAQSGEITTMKGWLNTWYGR